MSQLKYNPKELLSVLVDLDGQLNAVVDKNCPEGDFNVSGDLENALEDFLIKTNLLDDDLGYLVSQMALLQLSRELGKTIEIVVETNDLQAHYDFGQFKGKDYLNPKLENTGINVKDLLLGAFIGIVAVLTLFFFFK